MVVKAEQERVKTLIADTVSLLCKNGLHYTKEFSIEGLLGITLDRDEVFLVNIKEMVKNQEMNSSDSEQSDEAPAKSRAHKRKRRRSKLKQTEGGNGDMDDSSNDTNASFAQGSVDNEPPAKKSNIKEERTEEESDDEDLVFIKDEPGQDFSAFTQNDQSFSGAQSNNILGDLSQQGSLYATPTSASGIAAQGWDPNQSANFSQHSMSSQPGTPNASGQQQHSCPICQRACSTPGNLRRHMLLLHAGKYRYTCDYCSKGFANKQYLLQHLTQHTNQLHLACDVCGQSMTTVHQLRRHKREKHSTEKINRHPHLTVNRQQQPQQGAASDEQQEHVQFIDDEEEEQQDKQGEKEKEQKGNT